MNIFWFHNYWLIYYIFYTTKNITIFKEQGQWLIRCLKDSPMAASNHLLLALNHAELLLFRYTA